MKVLVEINGNLNKKMGDFHRDISQTKMSTNEMKITINENLNTKLKEIKEEKKSEKEEMLNELDKNFTKFFNGQEETRIVMQEIVQRYNNKMEKIERKMGDVQLKIKQSRLQQDNVSRYKEVQRKVEECKQFNNYQEKKVQQQDKKFEEYEYEENKIIKSTTDEIQDERNNKKFNAKEVTGAKLKKGEIIGMESNTGIILTKWKDKRKVLMLSAKRTAEMEE
ncbi:hypothetical protein ILUMI_22956 [Ignelater luminosus]|uniref:Uncharacterized protein n=1 Tax=Ignelater luminosus TaxID=2038154 RepID=A0A8K0G2B8_IGNLU|nr:hypothetical protein ILUMI_22956 [Ignelater luminosus]